MEANLELCKTIATQTGLGLQFVINEFHVFDVLSQIATINAGSKQLVFKGGTALNKIYFTKNQRFSEDLDFDLDTDEISTVREWCKQTADKITGYEITEFRRVRSTVQFYCAFQNALGTKDHVRIDVSTKKIITDKPLVIKPAVSQYSGGSVVGFYVYSLEDLVARKLNALHDRTEGKDIYDAYNALPLCGKMEGAIKKSMESEGKKQTPTQFVEEMITAVKKADAKKVQRLTNNYIPAAYRPRDWQQLKNGLVFNLEQVLQTFNA